MTLRPTQRRLAPHEQAALREFMSRLGGYRVLERDEERAIIAAAQAGDRAARDRLVRHNVRLVVRVALDNRAEASAAHDILDMVQDGLIGLLQALERFDLSRGLKFSTYAIWWVRQAITRGMDNGVHQIRLPVHVADRVRAMSAAEQRLASDLGRAPTSDELRRELAWGDDVFDLITGARAAHQTRSLDAPTGPRHDPHRETLAATVPAEPVTIVDEQHRRAGLVAVAALPRRVQHVLARTIGHGDTLRTVGTRLGVTGERVRQIRNAGLEAARAVIDGRYLTPAHADRARPR